MGGWRSQDGERAPGGTRCPERVCNERRRHPKTRRWDPLLGCRGDGGAPAEETEGAAREVAERQAGGGPGGER